MRRITPVVGEKINHLTLTADLGITPNDNGKGRGYHYARYLCDCGATADKRIYQVSTERIKTCGCMMRNIPFGQKFGRLTILERASSYAHAHGKQRRVLVQCDCGVKVTKLLYRITAGYVTSCGCAQREWRYEMGHKRAKSRGTAGLNSLYSTYRRQARERGFVFELTREKFIELTSKNCTYCGHAPSMIFGSTEHAAYVYNGIDRADSRIGYIVSNCVPACRTCNIAKRQLTQQEFADWVNRVHAYFVLPIARKNSEALQTPTEMPNCRKRQELSPAVEQPVTTVSVLVN